MQSRLRYAIKFVGDMDRAVEFHRDTLGLSALRTGIKLANSLGVTFSKAIAAPLGHP